ncbi:FUSC family protein [Komagataeibacter melaceti]
MFAVRTSLAAALSLLIAMWMELDSPQWAPLTVWVVAQSSRGESLSKARWRIAGTLIGCAAAVALIAAFPQAPGLFFAGLALWIGLCCGCATFFDGYRSYGLLVTSFTSAIVATGAIIAPDDVFNIAVSRGSYIVLGIVCEATLAALFIPALHEQARTRLLGRLNTVWGAVSASMGPLAAGRLDMGAQERLLGELVGANGRVEYDTLEMGPQARRVADHARAALADLMMAVARSRALAITGTMAQESVHAAIASDLAAAQNHILACETPVAGDRFRFALRSRRLAVEAAENGIRAAAGILAAWLFWEVTGWPAGAAFVSFVSLVYGLLATRENPLLASSPFFKGAVWCAVVAAVFVLLVMPAITAPEVLVLLMLIPMTIGGLAARTPATAGYAFSFNMFLPVLIGPANQARYDEVAFFNGTSAFLGAVLFAWWTFRLVLPFRPDSHIQRTEAWTQRRLAALADPRNPLSAYQWLLENAESMVRSVRNAQGVAHSVVLAHIQMRLNAMTVGTEVITIRDMVRSGTLPDWLERRLRVFLRAWKNHDASTQAMARVILRDPAWQDGTTPETTRLAGALKVIAHIQP